MKERELCPNNSEQMNSKQMNEVPFKMYNDTKDITVRLTELEKGWEMDKTPKTQVKFTLLFYQLTDRIINQSYGWLTHRSTILSQSPAVRFRWPNARRSDEINEQFRVTEQKTVTVWMSRTLEVVWAS